MNEPAPQSSSSEDRDRILSDLDLDLRSVVAPVGSALLALLPGVGTAREFSQALKSTSERMMARKVVNFLSAEKPSDRQAWIKTLATEEQQRNFWEKLLMVLHRMDDMSKAPLLYRVACAWAKDGIDTETRDRLFAAVNRAEYHELRSFVGNGTHSSDAPQLGA